MYSYVENMVMDIKEFIKELLADKPHFVRDFDDRDKLEDALRDLMWTEDVVIGNASGSYTFSRARARDYVCDNMDILTEMCDDFCLENDEIGRHFRCGDWEWFDVSIRCFLLPRAISEAVDEMNLCADLGA